MAYSLRLPPQIQDRIQSYLDNVGAKTNVDVIRGVAEGLDRIAQDPSIGSVVSPVYNRPVYRHSFKVGDTTYSFQAAYLVDEERESITISTFGSIAF